MPRGLPQHRAQQLKRRAQRAHGTPPRRQVDASRRWHGWPVTGGRTRPHATVAASQGYWRTKGGVGRGGGSE